MKKPKKKYSKEFKLKVVSEFLHNTKSGIELGEEYGIHPNLVYRWTKHFEKSGVDGFPGSGKPQKEKSEDATKDRLIYELRLENDILKKALSILSKTEIKSIR